MPTILPEPGCFANHLGVWAVEPLWFSQAVAYVKGGTWKLRQRPAEPASMDDGEPRRPPPPPFMLSQSGCAIIQMRGVMMKGDSKFEGTVNTVAIRRAIRAAVADERVESLLLVIDSPGGHTAGTGDLADDVQAANEVKPVHAFIEDMGASAAYWIASQARSVTVNPTGHVGSIGTYAVLYDLSKKAELEGVKVHVVSTGPYKGMLAEGAPILPEHVAAVQEIVDGLNGHFTSGVKRGRKMTAAQLEKATDGRVWPAATAKAMGLVDAVKSLDDVLAGIDAGRPPRQKPSGRARSAVSGLTRALLEEQEDTKA